MKNYTKYISSLLLFGLNGIVASQISLSSYEIVLLRTLIGSIMLFLLFKATGGHFQIKTYKKDTLFISLSGIAMGTSWMFLYEAYSQIGVSLSTLLYSCGPVFVMVLSPMIFHEKLTLPKITGFAIVFVGIILVNGKTAADGGNTHGLFCGAMSALTYSAMVIFNKQSKNINGMENSVIQLAVSYITVLIFMTAKRGVFFHINPDEIVWILILGVLNTGFGCYLYFSSINKLPAQTVAVCGYLELLSAVIFSAIILRERMTAIQLLGAILIVGGAMAGELVKSKKAFVDS